MNYPILRFKYWNLGHTYGRMVDAPLHGLTDFAFQISTIASILLSLVPFIFLILLNIFIFHTIKRKTLLLPPSDIRQRRDIFVATILVLIVIVYAACHTIKTAINIVELTCVITGKC